MHPFRVLHVLRAPVGGLFRHVRDLALEQSARGHCVGLVCDAGGGDPLTDGHLARLAPHLALGIARIPMPRDVGLDDVTATTGVRRLAMAMQIDILHGHGAKGGAYARLAARALRRRGLATAAFYTPHGGSLHYHPASLKGRLFMAAERRLARETHGLIFESFYAARTYTANAGAPPCPVRVVPNGIRPEELEPVAPEPGAADFVFVGELRLLKGVDVLIEATARIAARRAVRVAIVGAGPDREVFVAQAAAKGLADVVTFPGAMPAREAFRRGRALVLPSRAESLPYVALEAAGAGLPLIATDVGGIPEIVAGTDTTLVPAADAGTLAAAMEAVLDAPDAARSRAMRLRANVAEGFSVAAMTDAALAFYREAAVAPVASEDAA
ncbi:MAG: glycosyltransferase family 4 protein [Hyphomicrobiaceae bacterium]